MGDTIAVRRGSTLRLRFTVHEGDRTSPRRDLTGVVLFDASEAPRAPTPALTFIDATHGEVEVHWTGEQTDLFRQGRVQSFSLGLRFANGDVEEIPPVWLDAR